VTALHRDADFKLCGCLVTRPMSATLS